MPMNVSESFVNNATSLWLTFLASSEGLLIRDFTAGLGCIKSKLKVIFLCRQKMGDQNDWCEEVNFNLR